jgi:aminopeptidase N
VPTLLRGFSAPVRLDFAYSDAELAFLLANDSDPFNRWEAGQRLALGVLGKNIALLQNGGTLALDQSLADAFVQTLRDRKLDRSLIAQALTLPDEDYIAGQMAVVDPEAIHAARQFLRRALAQAHAASLLAVYEANRDAGAYTIDMLSVGRRRLKNLALGYLMELGEAEPRRLCMAQFAEGGNMTDVLAALTSLAHTPAGERDSALVDFYRRWRHDPLVLDKWFTLQATSPLPDTLAHVKALTSHPDFNLKNPNRVRSLIGAFTQRNPACFHARNGEGYRFLSDYVLELDRLNPQIAARLMAPFTPWRRYDSHRQELMQAEIRRILAAPQLSRDVYEVASKSLA